MGALSPLMGIQSRYSGLPRGTAVSPLTTYSKWWSRWGSNPRPPDCEPGALPIELLPHAPFMAKVRTLGDENATHDFQSCTFDHSVISPQYRKLHGGEGGFEPSGDLTATTVSRPPRSTTPHLSTIFFSYVYEQKRPSTARHFRPPTAHLAPHSDD